MVSTNEKFGCFLFEIPKVVYDGCIKIRFDYSGSEISSLFALPPLSKLIPVLGPVVFIELSFPDSV